MKLCKDFEIFREPLSSPDCFHIGKWLCHNHEYLESLKWFNESLKRYNYSKDKMEVSKLKIHEFAVTALNCSGQLGIAKNLTETLLKFSPNNKVLINVILDVTKNYEAYKNKTLKLRTRPKLTHENVLHAKSCRNELKRSPKVLSKLKCYYVRNTTAFTKLAPIKLEEANLDPFVAIFHDVMYDKDIEVIKNLSRTNVSIFDSIIEGV